MRNLQPADEREHIDIFTAIVHFDELILEVTYVRLDTVTGSHFDGEEVVVLLGLSVGGVLGDERLDYLFKVVERMRRRRVEPI